MQTAHDPGFSWQTASSNALSMLESSTGQQQLLPITLPQSTYDPSFSDPPFFEFTGGFYDGNTRSDPFGARSDSQQHLQGDSDAHLKQEQLDYTLSQTWGPMANGQTFANNSGHGGASTSRQMNFGEYSSNEVDFMSDQFLRMPSSKNAMPIVPIFEDNSHLNFVSHTPFHQQSGTPLSLRHPDFGGSGFPGQQGTVANNPMAAMIMDNVSKLEHQLAQQLNGSHQQQHQHQQHPLTLSRQLNGHSHTPSPGGQQTAQQQPESITAEQLQYWLTQQQILSTGTMPTPQPLPNLAPEIPTSTHQTAGFHDAVAALRFNSGAKEIANLPSAVPFMPPIFNPTGPNTLMTHSTSMGSSNPSLHVRTPAPRSHPYASPRLGIGGGAGLTFGAIHSLNMNGPNGGSARSMRPALPRITKREPTLNAGLGMLPSAANQTPRLGPPPIPLHAPMTTTYLAGLRREPSVSELASQRAPAEPYPKVQGSITGGMSYPLPLHGNGNGSSSLSGERMDESVSPFSSPMSLNGSASLSPQLPNRSHSQHRRHRSSVSMSPKKEPSAFSIGADRPDTATSVGSGGSTSATALTGASASQAADRIQAQTRATAARKRADDDIIQYSFRRADDWKRRSMLETVLASSFVTDNVMEPMSSGPGDTLTMGMGAAGKSVYSVFLDQVERSQWKCLFGDEKHPCTSKDVAFRRLERALDHVRSHLNHRPFGCKGECQKGDTCDARFFARSHLQDHVKRTESACCETCGQVIRIQNMPRHRMAH